MLANCEIFPNTTKTNAGEIDAILGMMQNVELVQLTAFPKWSKIKVC